MPDAVPQFKPVRMGGPIKSPDFYRREQWFAIRQAVLIRDEYTCKVCGKVITSMPQVDHIVPRRAGGSDDMSNLQTLCMKHHSEKTGREGAGGR
jgi:5-methylcytosine-specific restriction protein A